MAAPESVSDAVLMERLLAAKQRRRQAMAELPFEEKFAIVVQLRQASRALTGRPR